MQIRFLPARPILSQGVKAMKIAEQKPVETYRTKKIKKFLDKYFPYEPIKIPTAIELRNAIIRSNNGRQP